MLTCYDYPSARIIAESHLDCVLVGDSVAMAVHGHETTIMATMEMMCLHTQAVARGIKQQLIVSDLPFLCHRKSLSNTVNNVQKLMQCGAHVIKIEGGDDTTCQTIAYLVEAGVPIMGHIGLTPQSVHQLGGYRVQGKDKNQASLLLAQAQNLEKAGCSALVLECVPLSVAKIISESLTIPTIGIGASAETDGQVLVWHDMLGLQDEFKPRFLKHFLQSKELMITAINNYVSEVQNSQFPTLMHSFQTSEG